MSDSKVLKHTFLFSLFVLLAQVIGLVRDLYLVSLFGVGNLLDVYYMAFKITDILNVFYSVFLGSVIFVPLLVKAKNSENDNEMSKQVNQIGSLVMTLVIVVSVILFFLSPIIAKILAPSWDAEQLSLLVKISRILLIAQIFFPMGILAGSIGLVNNKPFGMASAGAMYNFTIFLSAIVLGPYLGIFGVVYGVILGAIVFALIQILPLEVRNIFLKFRFEIKIKEWFAFFKLNFSRFIAVLLSQIFGILVIAFATNSPQGGVTIFHNAYNLYLAFFFILGASFSTALMPKISQMHLDGDHINLKINLQNSISYMFFLSMFLVFICITFSKNIIDIIYYFSNISEVNIIKISTVFSLLILSLPFFNTLEILRKYMYSTNLISYTYINTSCYLSFFVIIYFILKSYGVDILYSIALSIFISNILTVLIMLSFLNFKGIIDFLTVAKDLYKSILISLFTFFTFIPLQALFSSNLASDMSLSYLFLLMFNSLVFVLLFVFYTFIFRDTIGLNFIREIIRVTRIQF